MLLALRKSRKTSISNLVQQSSSLTLTKTTREGGINKNVENKGLEDASNSGSRRYSTDSHNPIGSVLDSNRPSYMGLVEMSQLLKLLLLACYASTLPLQILVLILLVHPLAPLPYLILWFLIYFYCEHKNINI